MKEKVGILGYGEVGRAVAEFYPPADRQVKIKDLKRDDGLEGARVLNICIPYNSNFIKIVEREIKKVKPELVIIHSTVAPKTTKKISKRFKNIAVVHSPVRGIHPHLYEGIKTFVKYVGAENKKDGKLAEKHLTGLGIKTKVFVPSVTTELGKLFSTTYYGLCIVWHGEMKKICEKEKVDFEKAVTDFNITYNKGYTKLGKRNVVRPVLYPPEGGIKGHCILPNCEILKKYYKNDIFDIVLSYKPKNHGK